MTQQKIAVDSSAAEYWKSYFGSYGEQLVKDVLKKVATTIISKSVLRDAAQVRASLRPIASARHGKFLVIEGTAALTDGKRHCTAAFSAKVTDGKVEEVKTASIRG